MKGHRRRGGGTLIRRSCESARSHNGRSKVGAANSNSGRSSWSLLRLSLLSNSFSTLWSKDKHTGSWSRPSSGFPLLSFTSIMRSAVSNLNKCQVASNSSADHSLNTSESCTQRSTQITEVNVTRNMYSHADSDALREILSLCGGFIRTSTPGWVVNFESALS